MLASFLVCHYVKHGLSCDVGVLPALILGLGVASGFAGVLVLIFRGGRP
jgi:hypothetical protein